MRLQMEGERQVLAEAKAESVTKNPYPRELRAAYKRLIDNKLRDGLTPEEESELSAIRAGINRLDKTMESWRQQERAALVDCKLAELRRDIEAELERG